MIRPLHPTDMPSYLAFARGACYGEDLELCEPGPTPRSLWSFLWRSLAIDVPNHTWIYTQNRSIRGLVEIRNRRGAAVWEVERLLGLQSADTECILGNLLEHLAAVGGEEGVQKIFLRLPSASPLLPVARRAGFFAYTVERLYRGIGARPEPTDSAPRPRRGFDHLALFEHYSRTVPLRVRQAEAVTLQEWRWLDGWQPRRQFRLNLPRARRDYVVECDGQVRAWLNVDPARRIARLSLEKPVVGPQQADALLSYALAQLPADGAVYIPVREYQSGLEASVQRLGLPLVGENTLLVKVLTVRVPERRLVPVGA